MIADIGCLEVAALDDRATFAQRLLHLIDTGWGRYADEALTETPADIRSWAKTPCQGIRNIGSRAYDRLEEVYDRFADTPAVPISSIPGLGDGQQPWRNLTST